MAEGVLPGSNSLHLASVAADRDCRGGKSGDENKHPLALLAVGKVDGWRIIGQPIANCLAALSS